MPHREDREVHGDGWVLRRGWPHVQRECGTGVVREGEFAFHALAQVIAQRAGGVGAVAEFTGQQVILAGRDVGEGAGGATNKRSPYHGHTLGDGRGEQAHAGDVGAVALGVMRRDGQRVVGGHFALAMHQQAILLGNFLQNCLRF